LNKHWIYFKVSPLLLGIQFRKPLVRCCTKLWRDRQKLTSEMKSAPWN